MPVAIGDVLRVTCRMSYTSDQVQNVYHFIASGTAGATDAQVYALLDAIMDTAYGYLRPYTFDNLSYDSINVINVTQDYLVGDANWPGLGSGQESSMDLYAPQVAPLVLFDTDTLRSQGRKFLGGFTELSIGAGGQLATDLVTAIGSYVTAILAGGTVGSLTLEPGNWNAALARFALWTGAQIVERCATQRRRRIGVGS